MKYISFIFYFTSIFYCNSTKPKLCIDCTFFRKEYFTVNKFGKCSLFPKDEKNSYYLVDGNNKKNKPEYYYCSVARDYTDMCGPEGTQYIQKQKGLNLFIFKPPTICKKN